MRSELQPSMMKFDYASCLGLLKTNHKLLFLIQRVTLMGLTGSFCAPGIGWEIAAWAKVKREKKSVNKPFMLSISLFSNEGVLTCPRPGNHSYQSPAHLADKKARDDSVASKQPIAHPHLDNAPTRATELTASHHTRSYCRTRTTT